MGLNGRSIDGLERSLQAASSTREKRPRRRHVVDRLERTVVAVGDVNRQMGGRDGRQVRVSIYASADLPLSFGWDGMTSLEAICALSSKKISIYNEEMIVARCFIGFIIFSRKSLGNTFKATLDGRIQAIQEESQQFPNPNEVVPPESNEQQRLLRISLRICGTVVESLPMARCAPKCEKTVQALRAVGHVTRTELVADWQGSS
ncbi:hypothetical protein Dsin_002650 [Dipteronia sinensis]|uniref:ATP synthase protein MI25 n=1 Tax=Dipteronia sinensis TaxID=43782 RepID=A0AAE0EJW2_9ROSI|nr:hypothetical protein Dsin_002650 [Dipteronia sinensis]